MSSNLKERLNGISIRSLSTPQSNETSSSPTVQENQAQKGKVRSVPEDSIVLKHTIRVTLSETTLQKLSVLLISSPYQSFSRSQIIEAAVEEFLSREENKQLLSTISKLIQ